MEEGQITAKRVRSKKPADPNVLKGPGVATAGQWFVCTYCGGTAPKALVPAELIKGVAFDTFPCGLKWINDNASSAGVATALCDGFAKLYSQPPGQVLPAPATTDLVQFGGTLTQEQWLPNYDLWAQLTTSAGVTTKDVPTGRGKKKATTTGALTFEAAGYLIPVKGAPKRIDAVDGAEVKVKGSLTLVGAQRKVNKFGKDAAGLYVLAHFDNEQFSVTAHQGIPPSDDVPINNVASQLAGSNVYGPAFAVFTKKRSVKV